MGSAIDRIQKESSQPLIGYWLALASAVLWGVSGTFAQFLFEQKAVDPEWLVTIRLLSAGAILLIVARGLKRESLFDIWRRDALAITTFGIFGMLGVQYTYFAAIHHSNAATATVLQYLGPVFIAAYIAWIKRRIPKIQEFIALAFAVAGTFLLVTHGRTDTLAITPAALFWGLASAVALAFYSLQPHLLLRRYDATIVVGWGMIVGGVTLSFIHPPWQVTGVWDFATYGSAAFIIFFGSLIAFYGYLTAVKLIGADVASLLACAEPLSAAIVAVAWLGVSFGIADWLGTLMIIATIAILAIKPKAT